MNENLTSPRFPLKGQPVGRNLYPVYDGDALLGFVVSRGRMWTHVAVADPADVPQSYDLVFSAPTKRAAMTNLSSATKNA
jgi:hypothetical protein